MNYWIPSFSASARQERLGSQRFSFKCAGNYSRLHYESKAVHSQCLNNADLGVSFIYQHKLVQGALNGEPRVPRTQARPCFLLRRASAAVLPFCISLGAKAQACEVSYRSPV